MFLKTISRIAASAASSFFQDRSELQVQLKTFAVPIELQCIFFVRRKRYRQQIGTAVVLVHDTKQN